MGEVKLSLNTLFKRYPLSCKLNSDLNISALFSTFPFCRLTAWWSCDLRNQMRKGVEPLGQTPQYPVSFVCPKIKQVAVYA